MSDDDSDDDLDDHMFLCNAKARIIIIIINFIDNSRIINIYNDFDHLHDPGSE